MNDGLALVDSRGMPTAVSATALSSGAAVAHLSAAAAYGLWLPRLPVWLPTMVVLSPGGQRPERAGLYAFRSRAGIPSPLVREGMTLVPPEICLAQLAEDLRVLDLVVAIDSALHLRLCAVSDIEAGLRSRQRGLPTLREALALSDPRSESPWETILRVLLLTSGVDVQPQAEIVDGWGRFIARADLRLTATRRLMEYDGAVHRDRSRHQEDLAREKALSRAGWQRYGYTAKEILDHPERVLNDAEQALGLTPDRRRLATWRHLVSESSFSPLGRALLVRRLRRFCRPLRGRKARDAGSS